MNYHIKHIILVLIFACSSFLAKAQDIHYSQMYSTPLYINPAFTGNFDCNFRAGLNYRQQAASFTIPFETYSAWGDTRIFPRFLNKRAWIGLGAHLYYDNAGDGDLKKIQGMFFGAFSQGFNSDNSLYGSLGVGIGVTNRSIDINKLIFDDQWDTYLLRFDPAIVSADVTNIQSSSIFYPDFNLGLSLHHLVNEKWMYEVGGSISHINKPKESFFGEDNRVGRKIIVSGTAQYILSDRFLIKPEAYFIAHEGVQETIFGANIVYGAVELKLHGGLWTRLARDIIPVMGIEYNNYTLLFSYDINISKQRMASNYKGGFEFSLVKKFCYSPRTSTKRDPCKFLDF
ncbi:MAG: PorP/SprF family type IX secretion system membrane protein [Bacteroidetes bacterium]|nr:PorP/SprF family type IX secretion system membrane protein [Bacteroidota bacterium]MBL7105751.1 PorP/SprF family type IX secretion system membrane protein [Bacteroidales bacterium]